MYADLEMGLDTFGDVSVDDDGHPVTQAQVIRDIVEEGVLADQVSSISASGSTTATTSQSPRRTSCWPRSPREARPSASAHR
jgi:hypothetical protein